MSLSKNRTHFFGTCSRDVEFLGDSLKRIRAFPEGARQDMGYQIDKLQRGLEPDDWKPMPAVGSGVREIRVEDEGNIFRSFYVANIGDKIYILHAFQKKTQKTEQTDIVLGTKRLKGLKQRLAKKDKPS